MENTPMSKKTKNNDDDSNDNDITKNKNIKIFKREDLISPYIGKDYIKTEADIMNCKGGTFFIDDYTYFETEYDRKVREELQNLDKNKYNFIIIGCKKEEKQF